MLTDHAQPARYQAERLHLISPCSHQVALTILRRNRPAWLQKLAQQSPMSTEIWSRKELHSNVKHMQKIFARLPDTAAKTYLQIHAKKLCPSEMSKVKFENRDIVTSAQMQWFEQRVPHQVVQLFLTRAAALLLGRPNGTSLKTLVTDDAYRGYMAPEIKISGVDKYVLALANKVLDGVLTQSQGQSEDVLRFN
jgi:hypothetical protein